MKNIIRGLKMSYYKHQLKSNVSRQHDADSYYEQNSGVMDIKETVDHMLFIGELGLEEMGIRDKISNLGGAVND